MEEKKSSIQEKLSLLWGKATEAASQIGDSVKEQAERGKDFIEDKIREREANELYRKLGQKVYKLASRDELELPEVCEKYVNALDELLEDEDDVDDEDDLEPGLDEQDKTVKAQAAPQSQEPLEAKNSEPEANTEEGPQEQEEARSSKA